MTNLTARQPGFPCVISKLFQCSICNYCHYYPSYAFHVFSFSVLPYLYYSPLFLPSSYPSPIILMLWCIRGVQDARNCPSNRIGFIGMFAGHGRLISVYDLGNEICQCINRHILIYQYNIIINFRLYHSYPNTEIYCNMLIFISP